MKPAREVARKLPMAEGYIDEFRLEPTDMLVLALERCQREAIEAAAKVCDRKAADESMTFGFGAQTAAGLGALDCAALIRDLLPPTNDSKEG